MLFLPYHQVSDYFFTFLSVHDVGCVKSCNFAVKWKRKFKNNILIVNHEYYLDCIAYPHPAHV